ncbi:MAG: hypothetical protein WC956_10980 [bacterium]
MDTIKSQQTKTDGPAIDICPVAGADATNEMRKELLELQLRMATCSINHEYARKEFDDAGDREKREDLLEYMHDCRCEYFQARAALAAYDPYALAEFEADLMHQKQVTLTAYNA